MSQLKNRFAKFAKQNGKPFVLDDGSIVKTTITARETLVHKSAQPMSGIDHFPFVGIANIRKFGIADNFVKTGNILIDSDSGEKWLLYSSMDGQSLDGTFFFGIKCNVDDLEIMRLQNEAGPAGGITRQAQSFPVFNGITGHFWMSAAAIEQNTYTRSENISAKLILQKNIANDVSFQVEEIRQNDWVVIGGREYEFTTCDHFSLDAADIWNLKIRR